MYSTCILHATDKSYYYNKFILHIFNKIGSVVAIILTVKSSTIRLIENLYWNEVNFVVLYFEVLLARLGFIFVIQVDHFLLELSLVYLPILSWWPYISWTTIVFKLIKMTTMLTKDKTCHYPWKMYILYIAVTHWDDL